MTLASSLPPPCPAHLGDAWLAAALAALFALCLLADAGVGAKAAATRKREEIIQSRPAGPPVMAVVSLSRQRVTIYDADGWIMRAPGFHGPDRLRDTRRHLQHPAEEGRAPLQSL